LLHSFSLSFGTSATEIAEVVGTGVVWISPMVVLEVSTATGGGGDNTGRGNNGGNGVGKVCDGGVGGNIIGSGGGGAAALAS
jgi:hypothetical protein